LFDAAPIKSTDIANGRFGPLLGWLRTNIHEQGARFDMQTLLPRATGSELTIEPYLAHLERRYLAGKANS
jgi:carboxypeptidase Taq